MLDITVEQKYLGESTLENYKIENNVLLARAQRA